MSKVARLRNEHDRLIEIIDDLSLVIARTTPPKMSELDLLRKDLAETLIGHLKVEDWMLYPDLLESADPVIVRTARAFSAEMGGLAAAFLDYSEKWQSAAIDRDWHGFCRETAELAHELRHRIERENSELYPLLEMLVRAA